jgi:bifunctional non-homologous end joining protein LigD
MTPRKTRSASTDVVDQLEAIEDQSGDGQLELGRGKTLRVTSLGKLFFPDAGVTKGALMRYYAAIWPVLQPQVEDRPLVLKRMPDGVGGQTFYQQNAGDHVPDGVRVETVQSDDGPSARIIGGDLLTLLYTVQLGAIEVHPWLSRIADLDAPDRCLIDLDPGDDVPFAEVVSLARDVREIAEMCALPIAVKTSGSSGIHLVLPLPARTTYDISSRLATLIARTVVARRPERATVERSIRARPEGTIYVDAMQNARGKSMACAYSVRARPAATVSAPLAERELTARLRTAAFTIASMPPRVARLGDLWSDGMARRPSAKTVRDAMGALERVLDDKAATPMATPRRAGHRSRGGGQNAGARAGRGKVRGG